MTEHSLKRTLTVSFWNWLQAPFKAASQFIPWGQSWDKPGLPKCTLSCCSWSKVYAMFLYLHRVGKSFSSQVWGPCKANNTGENHDSLYLPLQKFWSSFNITCISFISLPFKSICCGPESIKCWLRFCFERDCSWSYNISALVGAICHLTQEKNMKNSMRG